MAAPAFLTGPKAPGMADLAERVGRSWAVVEKAIAEIPRVKAIWKYSKTSGWYITFDVGAKRLFYCFPQMGGCLLKIVYNEKGVRALKKTGLVDDRLANANKHAEGTLLEFPASELRAALLAELLRTKAASIR